MDYVITAVIALVVGAAAGLIAGYKWGQSAINAVMADVNKLGPRSTPPPAPPSPPPHV